jgi:hypothetical protein
MRSRKFSKFVQPKPCRLCGKRTTWSDVHGYIGLDLCKACFEDATAENDHLDNHDEPVVGCRYCAAEKKGE